MGRSRFFDESASAPDNAGIAPQPFVFDHERWVRLRRDQLSIDVIDPVGHQIGPARGINHRWSENREVVWSPVDGAKHVLVGEFDSFDHYSGDGDEWDWEFRIFPDPSFRFILDQVAATMSADDRDQLVPRERGPGSCVECEITPHEGIRSNPFFPAVFLQGLSPLLGQKLGLYGPWVKDFGHGGRPEIHPCEVIWWVAAENPRGVGTSRFVLVLQDDSDRLDWTSDYDASVAIPWSAFPRLASIAIALRPTVQDHTYYNLRLPYAREMADMADPADVSVTGQFGGQPVITVTKLDEPRKIRMVLSPVVPDPDGVHLRCFLYLYVQVSDADRAEAGYALLNLETLEPAGQPSRDPRTPPGGQTP